MVLFVKHDICDGLNQCMKRYARVNKITNTRLRMTRRNHPKSFDDVMSVMSNSTVGYILEDLAYPRESYDAYADLSFCPTRTVLRKS